MREVDHYRDLRQTSANTNPYINVGYWNVAGIPYLNYEAYLSRYANQKSYFAVGINKPRRMIGEPGGTKETNIEIETKIGICRDERCK